ncbi:MAG: Arc family DNA-binding protein [Polycyclovorans sp.]|nr:Arc family DNA-binding protein [Polycyclovorans sp.]
MGYDLRMSSTYPSDKQDKFMLRLPDGMRDKLKEAATAAGRSMNAEIVQRLEQSFDPEARVIQLTFSSDIPSETQAAMARGVVELAHSMGVKAKTESASEDDTLSADPVSSGKRTK